jgi:uncharacterized protein YodC (DUF2158 family)
MNPFEFNWSGSIPIREVVFDTSKAKFLPVTKCSIGGTVVLRSGGWPMVVTNVNGDYLDCQWHNANGDLCTAHLNKSSVWQLEWK